ncbi:hypothetical protein XELAEV_18028509mg [Xenopus laevis]|uniref:Uncharacterized protein n=1 Tax=Xenopus laevis TaxID=8355 RepID=A0A974HGW9_XENLA|nr:hypothetical protein XELAEV_18028509mg [Xenopus laevis]
MNDFWWGKDIFIAAVLPMRNVISKCDGPLLLVKETVLPLWPKEMSQVNGLLISRKFMYLLHEDRCHL